MQVISLENGLRLFLLQKRSIPVISVQVWYQTGSVQETDGVRGIAHLFEHMMFRGSKNFGPEEHARLIHDVGGHCNAYTTEHLTVYHESVPSEHLDLALRLEADRMCGLRLDQSVLNTEREVVKEEFHRYLNNPLARAFLEFRKRLYRKHPYHWTPLGELDDIARMKVDDCLTFYKAYYAPNNAALILVGDFEPQEAITKVKAYFGSLLPSAAAARAYDPEPDQTSMQRFAMKLPVEVPVMAIAFRAPDGKHADVPALLALDIILASGRSARLEEAIVKKRRVALHTGGHLLVDRDPGIFVCYAAYLPNRRESTVTEAILQEIRRIQKEGVTDAELEAAKNRLLSGKVFQHYSVDAMAGEIGWAEFIEGDYRRFSSVRERIDGVTADDVKRVAQLYLREEKMSILSVHPEKFRLTYWFAGLFYSLRG